MLSEQSGSEGQEMALHWVRVQEWGPEAAAPIPALPHLLAVQTGCSRSFSEVFLSPLSSGV